MQATLVNTKKDGHTASYLADLKAGKVSYPGVQYLSYEPDYKNGG